MRGCHFHLLLVLFFSLASIAGVVVPDGIQNDDSIAFQKWKARIRHANCKVAESCPAKEQASAEALLSLIARDEGDAIMTYLLHSDREDLRQTLSAVYVNLGSHLQITHTALQVAVMRGAVSSVRNLLLFSAAYPEMAEWVLCGDDAEQGALHMAVYLDDYELVKAFAEAANRRPFLSRYIFARNGRGETPLDAARRYGRTKIIALLETSTNVDAVEQAVPIENAGGMIPPELSALQHVRNSLFYVTPAIVAAAAIWFWCNPDSGRN